MHSVGDDMDIAPQSRCRTGMARESGQSEERSRDSNWPGALCRVEHEKLKKNGKHQSQTANPSEACIGKHRPRSAMETDLGE